MKKSFAIYVALGMLSFLLSFEGMLPVIRPLGLGTAQGQAFLEIAGVVSLLVAFVANAAHSREEDERGAAAWLLPLTLWLTPVSGMLAFTKFAGTSHSWALIVLIPSFVLLLISLFASLARGMQPHNG